MLPTISPFTKLLTERQLSLCIQSSTGNLRQSAETPAIFKPCLSKSQPLVQILTPTFPTNTYYQAFFLTFLCFHLSSFSFTFFLFVLTNYQQHAHLSKMVNARTSPQYWQIDRETKVGSYDAADDNIRWAKKPRVKVT